MRNLPAGHDLPRTGLPAQSGGEVEGPAPVAALDRHRLAGIQPDANAACQADLL
jgi:hypothetical protein